MDTYSSIISKLCIFVNTCTSEFLRFSGVFVLFLQKCGMQQKFLTNILRFCAEHSKIQRKRRNAHTKMHFNPRSPWGERPVFSDSCAKTSIISIHAPRGGSDFWVLIMLQPKRVFQSTLPVGGATVVVAVVAKHGRNFNPRSPWGERPQPVFRLLGGGEFQSTLPVGGATRRSPNTSKHCLFQSTLPVGGATASAAQSAPGTLFQSTLPVGGATADFKNDILEDIISIHAPRGGSHQERWHRCVEQKIFQSTLPVGGAT